MGPENDIIIKITGEADLDAAQKQLQELTKRSEDYEKQIEQLKKAEKADAQSLKETITDQKALAKALERNADYYREERKAIKDATTANKQSIKALTDQVKAYKTLHGQTGRAVQQLRAIREELMRMEDAGEFGSQAFIDLSIAAGKLEDQIGDTQQRIRILASDTKEMDAAMGLGDGLAGMFYTATSAAEVFGDDMEGLQRAFYKVQAAMSIVSGVQQSYNALQKDSNFMVVVNTALTKTQTAVKAKEAVATGKATVAQKLFNKVMMSNPAAIILGAVAALVAAYTVMSEVLGRVGDRQARLNKLQTENKIQSLQEETQMRIALMQAEGKTALDVAKTEEDAAQKEYEIRKDALDKANKAFEDSNMFNREKREEELKEARQAYEDAGKKLIETQDAVIIQRRTQEIEYIKSTNQANIDLMREGAAKEIAQINLNYNERLKTLTGNSAEEVALRKALIAQQSKEIAAVRRKYALQAQQTAIQEQKNLLKAMSQSRGTEADYAKELELTKAIAKQEAQARIDALDRTLLSAKEYAAQKKAIELELNDTIKQIDDEEANRRAENARRLTEIELKEANARKNALTGAEGMEKQKEVLQEYYDARKKQLEETARLEKEEVQRSTKTQEEKDAAIKAIDTQLNTDLVEIKKEGAQAILDVDSQYLSDLELAADKAAHAYEQAQGGDKLDLLKEQYDAQMELYDAQQKQLKEQYDAGLISYQEYKSQEWEITKATTDAEVAYIQEQMQVVADGFQQALGYMQQISDMAFEAINDNIQAELDALDEEYTTDWEEAQKNTNKKYITEKEYEKKKADLEMKHAKFAKAQAITNIGIQTALAVMNAMASAPWPLNIAMAILAGSMGVAQLALAAAKPLAQYEKGRKGGKGEYALVGEKGPEIMYVPAGASIVPNNKIATPEAWSQYGVPELPHTDPDILYYTADFQRSGERIDYDRMGAAVAKHLPTQRNVTVNVDRSGIHVNNGGDNHTYLNTKYTGSWQ